MKSKKADSFQDLLFEIGCEELPATNLADIFESYTENPIAQKVKKVFEEKRISFKDCAVFATPRRLVFYLTEVADAQSSKETLIKLMTKEDAYTQDAQPTEKLLTILKHRNTPLSDLVTSDFNGKPFVFIKKIEPARKTAQVLPETLEAIVKTLGFPKNMKWGYKWKDGSDLVFPRPIRSFLCLYGAQTLAKCDLAGISVGNTTSFFSKAERKTVKVKSIAGYFSALKKNNVILDSKLRKEKIKKLLDVEAAKLGGRLYEDPFLLNEVNFLVENPTILAAPFDKEFLSLPVEVLAVSMARKQRIFGVVNKEGKLLPKFLGVLDRAVSASEKKLIAQNFENILHAKLQDSLFFFREDSKADFTKKREVLKDLIFMKGAGSMLEKSDRLVQLAKSFGRGLGLSADDHEFLQQAAYLCKTDLLTQMVGEFPELQGVMGKYYSLAYSVGASAAEAIGEHYLPRTVSDKLPASVQGALLSIFDKNDLIAACFALGSEPTSSTDPYALRRSAASVIKIAIQNKLDISIPQLVQNNLSALSKFYKKENESQIQQKIIAFYKDRFKAVLMDMGLEGELIDAAMAVRFDKPYEVYKRAKSLSGFSNKGYFTQAVKVVERLSNILKGNKNAPLPGVQESLLVEEAERQVYAEYTRRKEAIEQAIEKQNYDLATSLYAGAFSDILGTFFEQVFVNAEDLRVRQNRLSLLSNVKELYTKDIADLSKIKII